MHAASVPDEPPLRTSLRRAGADSDSYRIWTEDAILRIEAAGTWDLAVAEAYSRDVRRIVDEVRLVRPNLRAIVDRSACSKFDADVHALLIATYGKILQAGDRIAIVVDSSLAKGPIRHLGDREDTQAFLSLSAARTWVLAYG